MKLIQKQNYVPIFYYFLYDPLYPLLKFSPIFAARHHSGQIQGQHPLVLHRERHVSVHNALGQPFHHSCLAHSGFTDQTWIVLGPPAENLNQPSDLILPADDRIQPPLSGHGGQIPAVLAQSRGFPLARSSSPQILLIQIPVLPAGHQKLHIQLLYIDPHGVQQPNRHILAFLDQGHENMLRSRLLLAESGSLPMGLLQNLFGSGRIAAPLAEGHSPVEGYQLPNHVHHLRQLHTVVRQNSMGHSRLLLQQARQNMLRSHISLLQSAGTLGPVVKGLLRLFRKS